MDLPPPGAGAAPQQQPSWGALARRHWPQYLTAALLYVVMRAVDPWEPRPRAIYHASDAELWQVGGWTLLQLPRRCCGHA